MPTPQPPMPNPQETPPEPGGWLDGPKKALGGFLQWWNKPFSLRRTRDKVLRVFVGILATAAILAAIAGALYVGWMVIAAAVAATSAMAVGLTLMFGVGLLITAASKGWFGLVKEFATNVWQHWTRPKNEPDVVQDKDPAQAQQQASANPNNATSGGGSGTSLEQQTNPSYRTDVEPAPGSTVARVRDIYNMQAKESPESDYKPQYTRPIAHDDDSVTLNFPGADAREEFFAQLKRDGIAFTAYDANHEVIDSFTAEEAKAAADELPKAPIVPGEGEQYEVEDSEYGSEGGPDASRPGTSV
jgi:hypothetical protein